MEIINIKDLVNRTLVILPDLNLNPKIEALISQPLSIKEMNDFDEKMLSIFGNSIWRWDIERWSYYCKNNSIDKDEMYYLFVRRNWSNLDWIVCDYKKCKETVYHSSNVCFTIDLKVNVIVNSSCKHINTKSVFIGPMIDDINYCLDCKQEIK